MANTTNNDAFITPVTNLFAPILPLVFDDSLTYYEQQAKLVDKLNQVIEFTKINSIKYANPIQWNITSQYESNTVVTDTNGNAYLSVQPVPAGISLNREEYWTKIGNFDALWTTVKSAITPYDEGADNVATRSYSVNDLVWVQDKLYVVTKAMTAGDKFLSGNSQISSINAELLKIRNLLESETNNRINSDNALSEKITTETKERVEGDAALQESVNAIELKVNSIKSSPFVNVSDYGITSDLVDATTTIQQMLDKIGSKVMSVWFTETINVNGEVTFPSNIDIGFNGGCIAIGDSGKITINGSIIADRRKIFTGATNSNLTIENNTNPVFYPEWFNNTDIQLAIDLSHYVLLGAKDYHIKGNITINKSNFTLYGYGASTYTDGKSTRLIFSNGYLVVGDVGGTVVNNFPRNINVGKFTAVPITKTNTAVIGVYGVINGLFEQIYIDSFNAAEGIYCYKNVHTFYKNIYIQSTNQSNFIGFHCGTSDVPILAGNNASLYFENCNYSCAIVDGSENNTIGWLISGAPSDVYLQGCETAMSSVGVSISDSSKQVNDVLIDNCIFDACRRYAMFFGNLTGGGTIQIANTYMANISTNDNPLFIVTNGTNTTFLINGMECVNLNSNSTAIAWASANANGIINASIVGGSSALTGTTKNLKGFYSHNGTVHALA